MATFTPDEIDFVRQNGNDACQRTWLGLWDPKRAIKQEHRDFMIDKYERKRYYLEPASPLKSLPANTTNSTNSLASSNGISGSNGNISSIKNGTDNLVPLKTVTLTPPTSLRLSRTNSNSSNGLHSTSSSNGSSSVTNSSTNLKFQQQFTPDDSNFFSEPPRILPPTPQKHSDHHHQRLNGTFERSQKNGLLTSISNANSNANKFTPDSDFVADFSNANIVAVNGTATVSNNNNNNNVGPVNGLKNNSNHKLINRYNENNGNLSNGHRSSNGSTSSGSEMMENFADFEHSTIYNAAEHTSVPFCSPDGKSSKHMDSTSSSSTTSVNSIPNDLFINNYSLLNNNTTTNSNNNNNSCIVGGGGGVGGFSDQTKFSSLTHLNGYNGTYQTNPANSPMHYGSSNNGYSYFASYHPNPNIIGHSGSCSLNFPTHANTNYGSSSTNSSAINSNVQWNLWQQFSPTWPPPGDQKPQHQLTSSAVGGMNYNNVIPTSQSVVAPNLVTQKQFQQLPSINSPNRWCLPVSVSASPKAAHGTSSATPSVDRYAALKDLDDQFREIKLEAEANVTNNNNIGATNGHGHGMNGMSNGHINGNHSTTEVHQASAANPFKTANPFQQQNSQPAAQTMSWAIPGANGTTTATSNGFYATSPYQNGFVYPAASASLLNGNLPSNGSVSFGNGGFHSSSSSSSSSTGAFGSQVAPGMSQYGGLSNGIHQPLNNFGHFGNPFMAAGATTGSSKSNNPFL
ncbi:nuclear transcription factor Y subunit alpha [Uranotaenia lowii]|uniref:nuclear transcription factor Y subunit alpha n=1 Tax=Uranotaenia lowii TaxID=190385 RepID=UPI002478385E|nr:nuclear transcription factor Y subunit alpha [Uranotaenia lowii]